MSQYMSNKALQSSKAARASVKLPTMDDLTLLKDAAQSIEGGKTQRNALIVEARLDGWPWARIAEAVNLTRQRTETIARITNGGELPKPRKR
jgi:hypothetical protein